MKSQLYVAGLIAAVATFVSSCSGENDSSRRRKFAGKRGASEMTTIDVEAASTSRDSGLSLAGDTVQSMKLKVSCTGIAEEVIEQSQFDLPVGATNCLAKLVSMKIGDKTYVEPATGSGFSHYLKNDTGVLVNQADEKDKIYLKVKSQLPSPLTADASVQYVYSAVTQFDSVDATSAPSYSDSTSVGIAAPKIKVSGASLDKEGELHILVSCTSTAGFEGTGLSNLKCDGVDVAKIKFAIGVQDEGQISQARLAEISKGALAVNQFKKPSVYNLEDKFIHLKFGKPSSKATHAFVASITEGNKSSYAFGFIRMGGNITTAAFDCPEQGAQANFIQVGVQLDKNLGRWRDTSNCWVWMRPVTTAVLSKDRFDKCPRVQNGDTESQLTLPFLTEMKAAYDRKIHELAKGAAPALGEDLADETFWLAGGRVFNMKDGSHRELNEIKKNEVHKVLCVIKKD